MPIKLNGATSGSVTLSAPAVAGTTSLELPTDSIKPGLVLVAASTFTTAAAVNVNNCFTALYDQYRLVLAVTGSASAYINYRMRAAGVDDSSSNYVRQEADYSATTATLARGSATTTGHICYATAALASFTIDIFGPAAAQATQLVSIGGYGGGTPSMFLAYNNHAVASAFDGITIYPGSGTITGTLYVYGYRKAL